jgi:DNA-binding CsgD family transcriptional regulator
VQFANRAALEIIERGDGLRLSRWGLLADHPEDNTALAQAQKLGSQAASSTSPGPRGSTIAVRRLSLKRPYTVQVMPMSEQISGTTGILGENSSALLMTITDPTAELRPATEVLMHGYGLTPTEAALALKIGEGASLKEAADQLSISEQTARWHLKNVLAKTETNRQSELVGMLVRLTTPLRDGPPRSMSKR